MNILILNGSPKGEYSVTFQTAKYLMKHFPEQNFAVLHVGQKIRAFEKDFSDAKAKFEWAECVLFVYPVYTFIAPYQLHRFIELMKQSDVDLSGKYASQITTSKHFYDVTAHRYIEENYTDMGMKIVRGLSADMDDLLCEKGRNDALAFLRHFLFCAQNDIFEPMHISDEMQNVHPVSLPEGAGETAEGDVLVLTNCEEDDAQLQRMIERFCIRMPRKTRVVNIRTYPFKGGCLGCFNCAVSGKCIYKDGFDTFLREDIQSAESIVYAFTIRDHSMGASFKIFDDRQFCNGHRTVTMGMPIGYLVSGAYHRESNLQTIIEARAQVGGNYLSGVATDECSPDEEIDRLCENLNYAIENHYAPPGNFYGVGGMKIFRDLIWLMQGMMKADHKFYKAHKQYDFPQKKRGTMLKMYLVGALLSLPKLKSKIGNKMNEGMIAPYKKALEK